MKQKDALDMGFITEIMIEEMVDMEIQIFKDSVKNKWAKEEESKIFIERINKNETIQLLGKYFSKDELNNLLLPEVSKRVDDFNRKNINKETFIDKWAENTACQILGEKSHKLSAVEKIEWDYQKRLYLDKLRKKQNDTRRND